MKVVLDSNVLVAAFATRGLCQDVLEFCLRETEIILSEFILKEVEQVLSKKLKVPPEKVEAILQFLEKNSKIIQPIAILESICRDPNDQTIIATAMTGKANVLVTGDHDLLVLKSQGTF